MKPLRILAGVLLLLMLFASVGTSTWLWTERRAILSQNATTTSQFGDLKEQITKAAEVQDTNRQLQNQVDDLQKQLGDAQSAPLDPATPAPDAPPADPAPNATPAAPTPTPGGPTPTPGGPGGSAPPADVLARMLEIETQVKAIRGLAETRSVERRFLTRAELREHLVAEMAKEDSPEDYRHSAVEFWLLGLAPKDIDLQTLLIDLQTEQIAGFYDPEIDSFFLIGENAKFSALDQITYAHEFDHNLQDQLLDLSAGLRSAEFDSDRATAFRAVVEGDATLLMQEWTQKELLTALSPPELLELSKELGDVDSASLESVPRIMREGLQFPYTAGLAFVQQIYARGGWAAVSAVLQDPPTSSEQILHPEKYLAGQRDLPSLPERFDLSGALGAGWTLATTNTLGEFDLRIMLEEIGVQGEANAAADGLGGIRYALYEQASDQTPLLQLTMRWDSAAEGQQFLAAFKAALQPNGDLFKRADVLVGVKGGDQEFTLLFSPVEATLRAALAAQP